MVVRAPAVDDDVGVLVRKQIQVSPYRPSLGPREREPPCERVRARDPVARWRRRGAVDVVTGWQRTERWLSLLSAVAAVAALLGWVGAVATGSGGLSVVLLLITIAATVFAVMWVTRPGALRWWSGLVVLAVTIGPACYAYVTLPGALPHVAGLLTIMAVALAGLTVVRRYEMPPVGR